MNIVSRTIKSLLAGGLLLGSTLGLSGCGLSLPLYTAEQTISRTFTTGAQPQIMVNSLNGKITVVAGTENTVEATVTKKSLDSTQAAAEAKLEKLDVVMTQEGNTLTIVARRADMKLSNLGAEITLSVPAGAVLDLKTSNGGITAVRVTGGVKADTSNGGITIQDGAGNLALKTSNGKISVAATQAVVEAKASNGPIQFSGSLASGSQSFNTSNGEIALTLPAETGFRVDADTSNGTVTSDFALNLTGGNKKQSELRGATSANPAINLTLHTSNGAIKIMQAAS